MTRASSRPGGSVSAAADHRPSCCRCRGAASVLLPIARLWLCDRCCDGPVRPVHPADRLTLALGRRRVLSDSCRDAWAAGDLEVALRLARLAARAGQLVEQLRQQLEQLRQQGRAEVARG